MSALQLDMLAHWQRPDHARKPDAKDWSAEASDFFASHPGVLDLFCRVALEESLRSSYVSAKWCWEETRRRGKGRRALNNNFVACAAELARLRFPELKTKLRTRGRKP